MAPAIKIVYNGDIYRLRSGEADWANILDKAGELRGEEGYTLKYTDTDGDQVTLTSESDFLDALAASPSGLRIHVLPARSKPTARLLTPVPVSTPAPAEVSAPPAPPAPTTEETEAPAAPPKVFKCTLFRMQPPAAVPEEPRTEPEPTPVAADIISCEGPAGAGPSEENTAQGPATTTTSEENAPKAEDNNTATSGDETHSVHVHITCDGCGASPITGPRYKCSECFDYDLCSTCEEANTHDPTHVLIKIRQPLPPGMPAFMMFPPWARGHPGSMHPLHFLLRGAGMGGCPMRGGRRPSHCPRRRGCPANPTEDNTNTDNKTENATTDNGKGKERVNEQGASSSTSNEEEVPSIPPWARLPADVVSDMDSALHAMGFGDSQANRRAIYRHGGDMDAIVPALLEIYG